VDVGLPQLPPWQVSPLVQALPSSHPAPLGLVGFEQVPVAGLQVPGSWHWSCVEQLTVDVGLPQLPTWQVSPLVQPLPSVHGVPFCLVGFEQMPVAGLQVPPSSLPTRRSSVLVDVGLPQLPLWQVSPLVQGLPSSHVMPLSGVTLH